jgi:hypothetical protein
MNSSRLAFFSVDGRPYLSRSGASIGIGELP